MTPGRTDCSHDRIRAMTFVGRVSWTAVVTSVTMAVNLMLSVLVSRYLGPGPRGVYVFLGTVAATLVQLGNLGMCASNTVRLAKDPACLPRVAGNSMLISGVVGSAIAVGAYFILGWMPQGSGSAIPGLLVLLTLVGVPVRLQNLLNANVLIGLMQISIYNIFELAMAAMSLGKVLAIFYLLHQGLVTYVAVEVVLEMTACAGYLWYIERQSRPARFGVSVPFLRGSLGYGLRSYWACFLGFLVLKSDIYLVTAMLGLESAGLYSLSAGLAAYLLAVPGVVTRILFPTLAAERERQEDFTNQVGRHVFLIMLVLVVGITVTAPWLIPVLYGRAFEGSVVSLIILMPGTLALGLQNVVATQLVSAGYPMFMVWIWLLALAVNFGLNLVLIPAFGIEGAAWASTIAYVTLAAGVLAHYVRQTGSALRDVFWLKTEDLLALAVRLNLVRLGSGMSV